MIEKDKELENLFLSSAPALTDDEQFMTALERKMNAVEFLKEEQENQKRSYRMLVLLGIFGGAEIDLVKCDSEALA